MLFLLKVNVSVSSSELAHEDHLGVHSRLHTFSNLYLVSVKHGQIWTLPLPPQLLLNQHLGLRTESYGKNVCVWIRMSLLAFKCKLLCNDSTPTWKKGFSSAPHRATRKNRCGRGLGIPTPCGCSVLKKLISDNLTPSKMPLQLEG